MDPDDHEPAGAPVPECRASRELTALETKGVISELLLRVEDHADLSTLKHGLLTAVSNFFMCLHEQLRELGSARSKISRIHMLLYLEHPQTRIDTLAINLKQVSVS